MRRIWAPITLQKKNWIYWLLKHLLVSCLHSGAWKIRALHTKKRVVRINTKFTWLALNQSRKSLQKKFEDHTLRLPCRSHNQSYHVHPGKLYNIRHNIAASYGVKGCATKIRDTDSSENTTKSLNFLHITLEDLENKHCTSNISCNWATRFQMHYPAFCS